MGRYRKIDPKIWGDEKFREFSDSGKLVFLFVLTHPSMTSLGAMRASVPGLATELGWEINAFEQAFGEALTQGMIEHDERASCVVVPNFLKYNGPESPNVVRSWANQVDLIPECALKLALLQRVKAFVQGLPKGFQKALPKAFAEASAKGTPNPEPEPEPEQEQEPEPDPTPRPRRRRGRSPRDRPGAEGGLNGTSTTSPEARELVSLYLRETGSSEPVSDQVFASCKAILEDDPANASLLRQAIVRYGRCVREKKLAQRWIRRPATFFQLEGDRCWRESVLQSDSAVEPSPSIMSLQVDVANAVHDRTGLKFQGPCTGAAFQALQEQDGLPDDLEPIVQRAVEIATNGKHGPEVGHG